MAILDLARSIGKKIRVRYDLQTAQINNLVFRLHYRYTSYMLFFLSGLITTNYFLSNPMACHTMDGKVLPFDYINAMCWVSTTYTIPTKRVMFSKHTNSTQTTLVHTVHQTYYQWVPTVLFLQGVLFYFPHFIWKNWEDGRILKLTAGLRGPVIDDWNVRRTVQTRLAQFVVDRLNTFGLYATLYIFCETLNFINVICNVIFINWFLGGAFFSYGFEVMYFSAIEQESRYDDMATVFPKLAMCTLSKYGPSGSLETLGVMCILTSNMYNEKIYILLWFWFFLLTILSGLALAYSAATILLKPCREKFMIKRFAIRDTSKLKKILKDANIEDYLLFRQIGKNVNPTVLTELIDEIYAQMFLNEEELKERN